MKKIIISAIASNGIIGSKKGGLPWNVKEEFAHFKATTTGFPIIMGRKTFEELGKPLINRINIVVTRNSSFSYEHDEVKIVASLDDAIQYCTQLPFEKVFIIGGGEIYRQAIDIADEMILSFMHFDAEGDIYFPPFNNDNWEITSEDQRELFTIKYYRKNLASG